MAAALDVHWTTLSRWERGVAEPQLNQLWEAARLYLQWALAAELHSTGTPLPECRVPRAVIFCDEQGAPGVDWFVRDALARGDRVNILVSDSRASFAKSWKGLTAGTPAPLAAQRKGRVQLLQLDSVFQFTDGGLDVRKAFSAIMRQEDAAISEGWSGVAWLADCRTALRRPVVQASIMSFERLTESLAGGASSSRGLVLYPSEITNPRLRACLLCSHRWVVSGQGPVHNVFYGDLNLCLTRVIEEAADGQDRGDEREGAPSRVRPDCQ